MLQNPKFNMPHGTHQHHGAVALIYSPFSVVMKLEYELSISLD